MRKIIKGYIELTKPRITSLVLVITALGYYLGGKGIQSYWQLFFLLIGSALVCAGASALNHFLEREFDSKMNRTKRRPLPVGIIKPARALNFGVSLVIAGIALLYVETNVLTAFLSLLTVFLYVLVYTPMKRVSWINTSIGAIPGAIPTLGGWSAATNSLSFDAGILFLILFIWQHPHFYAIAWMYKEDYERGGFKMLPSLDQSGERTFRQILWYAIILIPVSIVPTITGLSGPVYAIGALLSGIGVLLISIKLYHSHSIRDAHHLLRTTVVYLPILLFLIVIDLNVI